VSIYFESVLFSVQNLGYRYGASAAPALNDVSLAVDGKRITGLAGANGSGKTTLIRVLLGQLVDFTGEYAIDGVGVADRAAGLIAACGIGYAPDTPILDEILTGYEILSLVAEIRKVDSALFKDELVMFRELLRLEEWLENKQCHEYSAGMRRKIAIAVAYLGSRSFVVLDEPTNDLDPLAVFGLKKLIAYKKARGAGTLVSSHMLDFVEKTVDDVVLLSHGLVAHAGRLAELHAAHPQAATLDEIYFGLFSRQTA
jgi:ABC-type multidrug transport system ATPase subunit